MSSTDRGDDVQWLEVLAAKPADQSSIPGIHRAEGKNGLLQKVFDLHRQAPTHIQTNKEISAVKFKSNNLLSLLGLGFQQRPSVRMIAL